MDFVNKIFRGDRVIWMLFVLLALLSLVEVYSASSMLTFRTDYWRPILRHALFLVAGMGIILIVHAIPARFFALLGFLLPAAWLLMLGARVFGAPVNGSYRWISMAGITFQPSEIAKICLITFTAFTLSRRKDTAGDKSFSRILIVALITCALIFVDNGSTALLLFAIVILMMMIGQIPLLQLGKLLLSLILIAALFGGLIFLVYSQSERQSVVSAHFETLSRTFGNAHRTWVDAHPPRVDVHPPRVDAHLPRVDVHPPWVDAHLTRVDVHLPRVDAHLTRVDAHLPRVDAHLTRVGTPETLRGSLQASGNHPNKYLPRLDTWIERIKNFGNEPDVHDPDFKITDDNYQTSHAKMAIAGGGVFGKMPGHSVERDFLPQAYSDFIYAVIIEETGLVGGLVVLLLYIILFIRSGIIANRSDKLFLKFMVMGSALILTTQALSNMAVAVGLIPVTGQTLPLVSRGGTSILITCIYFGIILSVSRFDNPKGEEREEAIIEAYNEDEETSENNH
jgi:cell division protein FtsW (lipid II flippase)